MIEVAIIEDNAKMLNYLKDILNDSDQISCQHCYANAEDAIHFLPKHESVDIVLVDIGLPRLNGIECVELLKAKCAPKTQFMMHTVFAKEDDIFNSLKAGANGYLLKEVSSENIISAIFELYNNGAPMSPAIARKVTRYFQERNEQKKIIEELTADENRILAWLAEGRIYRDISEELNTSVNTIKQRIHRIYKKLHVQNKTEAINFYFGRKQ